MQDIEQSTSAEGHERYFLSAPDTMLATDTPTVVETVNPEASVRDGFDGREALVATTSAEETLGWTATRSWRDLRQ